jgi:aarF domain-containing kinase
MQCLPTVQDHLLPSEYVVTMRQHMLDQCPVSSFKEVKQIVEQDLGRPLEELYASFGQLPIASASLAQARSAFLYCIH